MLPIVPITKSSTDYPVAAILAGYQMTIAIGDVGTDDDVEFVNQPYITTGSNLTATGYTGAGGLLNGHEHDDRDRRG